MTDRYLLPVSELFGEFLPEEIASGAAEDEAGAAEPDGGLRPIDRLVYDPAAFSTSWDFGGLSTGVQFYVVREVAFELPLLTGVELRLGVGELPGFRLNLVVDPAVQFRIDRIGVTLRLPPTIAATAERGEDDVYKAKTEDEKELPFDLSLSTGFEYASPRRFRFLSPELEPVTPFRIGETKLFVDLGTEPDIDLVLGDIPERLAEQVAPDFEGLWIGAASVYYSSDGDQLGFSLSNAGFGKGGFTGTVAYGTEEDRDRDLSDEEAARETEDGTKLQGMDAVLRYGAVEFRESIPVGGALAGFLFMPLAERWFSFDATLGGPDGVFMLAIGGASGDPLISFELDWLEIDVDTLTYLTKDQVHYASIDGSVRPKLGDFDWPELEVENLRISSEGDIDFDGGWVNLPEAKTLDFKGFKLTISEIGFGAALSELTPIEERHRWVGVSGGFTLAAGLPITAAVEGLTIKRYQQTGDIEISMDGIEISLSIPNTLSLYGRVTYERLSESPGGVGGGLTGDLFTGAVRLSLDSVKLTLDGQVVIGRLQMGEAGRRTVFYSTIDMTLPSPIPLGSTGAAIYGFRGLFGAHFAPDRPAGDDGEPVSWYDWYKGGETEEAKYTIRHLAKWAPEIDHYAVGAGLMIGTQFDGGYSLNLNVLAVVVTPGPVILIEGRANILKKLSDDETAEGAFYAIAVFDGLADTFQINVDVRYALAKVVEVSGGLEAFFDFNDRRAWHIYLGMKEPQEKRIRAEVLEIIGADNYLMIRPTGIEFGADTGVDWEKKFGPVQLKLAAMFGFEAGIGWNPRLFEGAIEIEGGFKFLVFGFGFDLLLFVELDGKSPDPYFIEGSAGVTLKLPWPIKGISVEVAFKWGRDDDFPRVDPLVTELILSHHKTTEGRFLAFASADAAPPMDALMKSAPIVPIDATPLAAFAKAVGAPGLPDPGPDVVDGWELRYRTGTITLDKIEEGGAPSLRASTDVGLSFERVLAFDADSLRPDRDGEAPELELWRYDALSQTHSEFRAGRADAASACRTRQIAETHRIDWVGERGPVELEASFVRKSVLFIPGALGEIEGFGPPPLLLRNEEIRLTQPLEIVFPGPIGWVTLRLRGATIGEVAAKLHRRGRLVGAAEMSRVSDTEADLTFRVPEVEDRGLDAEEEGFEVITLWAPPRFRTHVGGGEQQSSDARLRWIEWKTLKTVLAEDPPTTPESREAAPAASRSDLMLEPNALYRVSFSPETSALAPDAEEPVVRPQSSASSRFFFFRTAGPPGANDAVPALERHAANQLGSYVLATEPADGASFAYYGYDLAVLYNEAYAPGLYEAPMRLRITEKTGLRVGEAEEGATLADSGVPLRPSGDTSLAVARELDGCGGAGAPGRTAPAHRRSASGLRPTQRYVCEMLNADVGEKALHRTMFATSRFKTFEAHMRSLDDGGARLRRGPLVAASVEPAARMLTEAASAWRDALAAYDLAQRSGAPTGRILALEALDKAYAAFAETAHAGHQSLDGSVAEALASVGLERMPPPRHVELVAFPLQDEAGLLLRLDSPEPFDWRRLSLFLAPAGAASPIRALPAWREDGAQAYLLAEGIGPWPRRALDFVARFARGGADRGDLTPLSIDGDLTEERVEIAVDLSII